MSAGLKFSVEPDIGYFDGILLGGRSPAERKHVGIVVFSRKFRHLNRGAETASDPSDLVRSDGNAYSRSAHHNVGPAASQERGRNILKAKGMEFGVQPALCASDAAGKSPFLSKPSKIGRASCRERV